MATHNAMDCISIDASGDLSAAQFHFVSVDSNGQIALTGDGAHADGVLQNDPDAAGKAGEVAIRGVVKVEASAAIAAGAEVSSTAAGEAVTATSGDIILGTALKAASGDGSIIPMLFNPRGAAA